MARKRENIFWMLETKKIIYKLFNLKLIVFFSLSWISCLNWSLALTAPRLNSQSIQMCTCLSIYVSDKEKIMCNVDEKDIAEHLRVLFFVLNVKFALCSYFSLFVVPFVPYIVNKLILIYLCRWGWRKSMKRSTRRKMRLTVFC